MMSLSLFRISLDVIIIILMDINTTVVHMVVKQNVIKHVQCLSHLFFFFFCFLPDNLSVTGLRLPFMFLCKSSLWSYPFWVGGK